MTRPLRLEFPGALYHITSRGNECKTIFFDDSDFRLFLEQLEAVCEQFRWNVYAYCLMTNHYHLLVETPEANICKGMRQLNGVYSQAINRKYLRVGHLFQGRYKAILVEKDAYLLELSRYIVLNPIRACLVQSLSEWPWSSWAAAMGYELSPKWLQSDAILSMFAEHRADARLRYMKFIENGKGIKLWQKLKNQVFLGTDDFVETHLELLSPQEMDLTEIPCQQKRPPVLSLAEYAKSSVTRNAAIAAAYRSGGYTLKELGDFFGIHYSSVSRIVAKNKT
jgi:putative transposase